MPTRNYIPPGIEKKELEEIFQIALPGDKIVSMEIAGHGSTNLVYKVGCEKNSYIAKIAYRHDRLPAKPLEKEVKMLDLFAQKQLSIPLPRVIWSGQTLSGLPAMVETFLPGEHVEKLLPEIKDIRVLARALGKFCAELHQTAKTYISEFKADRPDYPDFASFVREMLAKWEPALAQAGHIPQTDIVKARAVVRESLPLFTEKDWPYVHADISQENLFGKIADGDIALTGLCDFENVMTAPPEYEFATIDDTFFVFYPEMEKPFYEAYAQTKPLPTNFGARLRAVSLFRALRYIRRSVEYHETHYFEHDLKFFKRWIK